jgi:hypothetical protein
VPRFYFQLEGAEKVKDTQGSSYEQPIEAFKAAEKLAKDISETRPQLRGTTCVIVTQRDRDDLYCVSIQ